MDVLQTFHDMLVIPALVLAALCLFWGTAQAATSATWDHLIRQVDASRVDRQAHQRAQQCRLVTNEEE